MTVAFDQFAKFTSSAPLTRATLRRDKSRHLIGSFFNQMGRSIREWGYSTSLYEHRLRGKHPLQLLGSPDDPAPGNATLGSAIFGGDMLFENEQCKISEHFWKHLENCSPAFRRYAHSFHWLQDLAQTKDQAKARDAAETIISWWLPVGESWDKEIWGAETLARRLINWLSHAPLILSSNDLVYRSKLLLAMARHARHLTRVLKDTPQGLPRLYTGAALTLSGLLLPNGEAWRRRGLLALEEATKAFILPDGGPASRNASDAIRAMQLLIIVRTACVETNSDLPPWIQITLDRLAPFVRAVRHGDGSLAQFGGASADGGHGVEAILAASEARGKATENSAHAGIQRVQISNSCLIVDTGTPPAYMLSEKAHAGTGAFEFSAAADKIIVNVGAASERGALPQLAALARTTAAHSTLVISNRNSTRVLDDGRLGAGVSETLTLRETLEDGTRIKVMHDGYEKRFGVKHERSLSLTDNGKKLVGEDKLFGPKLKKLQGAEVIIRFHLHPTIEACAAPDGRITLETRSGKLWIFDAEDGTAEIEDSLYIGHPLKPEASRQITVIVPVKPNNTPICKWVLSEMDSA